MCVQFPKKRQPPFEHNARSTGQREGHGCLLGRTRHPTQRHQTFEVGFPAHALLPSLSAGCCPLLHRDGPHFDHRIHLPSRLAPATRETPRLPLSETRSCPFEKSVNAGIRSISSLLNGERDLIIVMFGIMSRKYYTQYLHSVALFIKRVIVYTRYLVNGLTSVICHA